MNFFQNGRPKTFILVLFGLFAAGRITAQTQDPFCRANYDVFPFTECEEADCIICDLNGFMGTSEGFGTDPDGDLSQVFCSSIESVQYLKFMAAVESMVITVTVSNCSVNSGVDLALMPECDLFLNGCVAGNGTNTTTISLHDLIIGNTYLLIIDIDAGSYCNYVIHTSPPDATVPPGSVIPADFKIQGDSAVCPNATVVYKLVPDDLIFDYTWTAPVGATINGQASTFSGFGVSGSTVTVTWGATGGNLCVLASNNCNPDYTKCHPVVVKPIPTTVLPSVTICPEEVPYVLDWGEGAYVTGNYSITLPSYLGCDSVVQQFVTVRPLNNHNIGPIGFCPGSCIQVCNETFCDVGDYVVHCQSAIGCDSVITFSLFETQMTAQIVGERDISCDSTSLLLSSMPSPGTKTWYNQTGDQIGAGNTLLVTTPGTYVLSVSLSLNGNSCILTDTVTIQANTTQPSLLATGALITCDSIPATIHASSNAITADYYWLGPNGFTSSMQNPSVPAPGAYFVTVVDKTNGCTNTDTAFVLLCCQTFAGNLDTTPVTVCAEKQLFVPYLGGQVLAPGYSLVFILYSDPALPLNSILMINVSPEFPFVPGVTMYDSTYYVAAVTGHILPNHMLDTTACYSLTPGPKVKWHPKPVISTIPTPHAVCRDGCMDVTFDFTGTPPFEFAYEVSQNGQVVYSGSETAQTMQKTISICPGAFHPPCTGSVDFRVTDLRDLDCSCQD